MFTKGEWLNLRHRHVQDSHTDCNYDLEWITELSWGIWRNHWYYSHSLLLFLNIANWNTKKWIKYGKMFVIHYDMCLCDLATFCRKYLRMKPSFISKIMSYFLNILSEWHISEPLWPKLGSYIIIIEYILED